MKILYLITQAELGGAQVYIKNLCKGLREKHSLVVAYGETKKDNWLGQELDSLEINHVPLPRLVRSICPIKDLLSLFDIYRLIRKEKPDVIHLNSSKISVLGSLAGHLYGKAKIVYTVHGWVFNEPARNNNFYKKAEKFSGRFKDKLICVSQFDYDLAIKEKIVPKEKLLSIHNGIKDVDFLSKEEARKFLEDKLSTEIDFENYDFVLGSIGNLYKTKGYEYLINAVRILVDQGHNVLSVIIGEGKEREELENWVEELKLKKNVILPGKLDNYEAARLLKAFDIYINSSVKEGLTTTIIEAMQAGLPVVATRVGGTPEIVDDQENGFLLDSESSKDLAEKIKSVLSGVKDWDQIGEKAMQKARNEFSFEQMVKRTEKVYLN